MQIESILILSVDRDFVRLDIAGERLWIELKRIAEGHNAGPVLKVMLEQNVGSYLGKSLANVYVFHICFACLGIPSNSRHLNKLIEHWQNCYQAKPNAMTILMKLFDDVHEVSEMILSQEHYFSFLSVRLARTIRTTHEVFK